MPIPHPYQPPKDFLTGRNVLVTGAGDGIGAAAARAYAAHGATVILLGKTQTKLESVYDRIVSDGSPEPIINCHDLSNPDEAPYSKLAELIDSELGCLHGLLHNASVLGPRTPIEQISLNDWNTVLQVNLTSNFLLSKHLLNVLRAANQASVIFTSSGVGRAGRAYWGAYSVSKFGVEALSQILADEHGNTSHIRVNCLNPGATNTQMRRTAYPAEHPDKNPRPDQILDAYLYLMGADSAHLNGQSLNAQ